MARLEMLGPKTWGEFLEAPATVLMLGKTDCAACAAYTEELTAFLDEDDAWADVRFGKLLLDQPGLVSFKRANPWVADLHSLPFTVIFKDGEKVKEFAGGGIQRLTNRLDRVFAAA